MNFCCTRTGNVHLMRNCYCEDSAYSLDFNDFAILCVLDGCSSAALSEIGSPLIGQHLMQFFAEPGRYMDVPVSGEDLCRYFFEKEERLRAFGDLIINETHKRTSSLIYTVSAPTYAAFSTTLIAALIHKKTRKAYIISVGDCFALAGYRNGAVELITPGENREDCMSKTYFITNPIESYTHIRYYIATGFDSICLSTDGLLKAARLTEKNDPLHLRDSLMNHLKEAANTDSNAFMQWLLKANSKNGKPLFPVERLNDDIGVAYCKLDAKNRFRFPWSRKNKTN